MRSTLCGCIEMQHLPLNFRGSTANLISFVSYTLLELKPNNCSIFSITFSQEFNRISFLIRHMSPSLFLNILKYNKIDPYHAKVSREFCFNSTLKATPETQFGIPICNGEIVLKVGKCFNFYIN